MLVLIDFSVLLVFGVYVVCLSVGFLLLAGEILEDGVIGSDDAREAKIEDTLRKMGVQSIGQVRAAKAEEDKENKSVGKQITSIFDVSALESCMHAVRADLF